MSTTRRMTRRLTQQARASDFFPVHLSIVQPATRAPVDLYLYNRRSGSYILYKAAYAELSPAVHERLVANGIEDLYMRRDDEDAFYEYAQEQIHAILRNEDLPPETAWPIVRQATTHAVRQLFEDPRSGERMDATERMVRAVVYGILKHAEPLRHMTDLLSHDHAAYSHCVDVCLLLTAACKDVLGIRRSTALRPIALGAVLHDLGLTQLPGHVPPEPVQLSAAQRELYREHPVLGVELVEGKMELSPVTRSIIRHHCERQDGTGYPDGLRGEGLAGPVRLAAIVDVYEKLTTPRTDGPALDAYSALERMVRGMPGRFDVGLLRQFIRYLGPSRDGVDSVSRLTA